MGGCDLPRETERNREADRKDRQLWTASQETWAPNLTLKVRSFGQTVTR